jgi:hypothetical protein
MCLIDLARLLDERGGRDEDRNLLAPVYSRLSESFGTPDLMDPQPLLEKLA